MNENVLKCLEKLMIVIHISVITIAKQPTN